MNVWLVSEGALLLVLVIALWRRKDMASYQIVLMVVCGLLLAISLTQSVVDGPSPLALGLGALAMTFFGIEIVRQLRSRRAGKG